MMSAKSAVIPPSRKIEKPVIATALNVNKAAKIRVLGSPSNVLAPVKVDMEAERITTRLVMDPATKPATTSMIGSFLSRRAFPFLA